MNLAKYGLVLLVFVLGCCEQQTRQVTPFLDENPPLLSQWGVVQARANSLITGTNVVPYDLNSPLFTDSAHKFRTLWLPKGVSANYRTGQALDFPVGTILSKTFYYPKNDVDLLLKTDDYSNDFTDYRLDLTKVHLVETRILVHRKTGWTALPYIWNEAQTDALLERAGGAFAISLQRPDATTQDFTYIVPNANQCAGCHATNAVTKAIAPIGPAARHLNKAYAYASGTENQLAHWARLGLLAGYNRPKSAPKNADWRDESQSLSARAAAYLEINCGHCHNPDGAANTSALHLDKPMAQYAGGNSGLCKPPVAAGQGTGGHKFDIVPGSAKTSILWHRMNASNPAIMMPELGRSTIDDAGVALIGAWIDAMDGACE